MIRNGIPPAIIRPAEDLAALARRVSEREKKNRKGQLDHVKKQAADVLAARQQSPRGTWGPWCQEAGLSQPMAWMYAEMGKSLAANGFSDLPEDEQWAKWKRISGHAAPIDEEYDLLPIERDYAEEMARQKKYEQKDYEAELEDSLQEEGDGDDADEEEDPNNLRTAYFLKADLSIRLAAECLKLGTKINATRDVLQFARRAAASWAELVTYLES